MMSVAELFESKTLSEVRDYNLELSFQHVKAREALEEQLQKGYNEIIDVSKAVEELYQGFKRTNKEFMELCFNDAKFFLSRIEKCSMTDKVVKNVRCEQSKYDSGGLLNVSDLSISVSEFISEPVESRFKRMIELFSFVEDRVSKQYFGIVQRTCEVLEEFLVRLQPMQLTLPQLVELYEFMERFRIYSFRKTGFKRILELLLDNYSLIKNSTDGVKNFAKRVEFIDARCSKLVRDSELCFERLDRFLSANSDQEYHFSPYKDAKLNVNAEFIRDVVHYEQGLTSIRRVSLVQCIDEICAIVTELTKIPGTETQVSQLKERLMMVIDKELELLKSQKLPESTDAVEKLILQQNTDNYHAYLCRYHS